ncbi:MAG: PDZ domain-containing protein [Gammaproteobacteria bacterium]|nr:PDZ domain-containing protein [Gammaproteobacteria bacterium]
MSSGFFKLVIALLAGIVLGIISVQDNTQPVINSGEPPPVAVVDDVNLLQNNPDDQYIKSLQAEILQLKARLKELEQSASHGTAPDNEAAASDEAESVEKLTVDNLVAAGVLKSLAEDIIRRQDQYEFQLLELSDRAIRENYIKTPRYFQEYRKLAAEAVSLRKEIGVDSYDNYLYNVGQNNRVVVQSVMSASPAEQHGIEEGDIVMSYADKKVLEWRDLSRATTQGVRGEYVGITLLRDDRLMTIMVPRGPLGVKLGSVRLDPAAQYSY